MSPEKTLSTQVLHVGIDIGSTTTKVAVIDPTTKKLLFSRYKRHQAQQTDSVIEALRVVEETFPHATIHLALCGSGAKPLAEALGVSFIQEVVANSIAIRALHPSAQCAIELGGQDAKIIFFHRDEKTGELDVSDMRMNGSCAGGTGAFIDEIATLLKTPIEHFNELAESGKNVYDISGRCGVYAKTDIQPLLNQGVARTDIALSAFHAIAKQTIGGLAQGIEINAPVIFEGGPLTFNPTLIRVFAERLNLNNDEVIIPQHPEIMMALGSAFALSGLFAATSKPLSFEDSYRILANLKKSDEGSVTQKPFFQTAEECDEFYARHQLPELPTTERTIEKLLSRTAGQQVNEPVQLGIYLGIDSGSTTTKFVFLDEEGTLIDYFYAANEGEPLKIAKEALVEKFHRYAEAGIVLNVLGVGTTGYGELLFNKALHADYHTVETVAHSFAATTYSPEVSFILDIGGQDMKAIWIEDQIISNIIVNEACSSGCGSFLENFALSLGISVDTISNAAFTSHNPAALGSRCTVFMTSSIVTEQKNGKTPEDIMAGLCRSIIENVFTKVIRVSNLDSLGDHIVVQGGTFRNDAVLRAIEQYLGKEVRRAPYPGLMGALGVALLTRQQKAQNPNSSSFIGFEALEALAYEQEAHQLCPFCSNHCSRTFIHFSNGETYVVGHRCAKGEIVGDPRAEETRTALREARREQDSIPNLFTLREQLLFKDYPHEVLADHSDITIGLPRVLAFWEMAPFWQTFFQSLGYRVVFSYPSTQEMFEEGLPFVTSDTICFPAKLVHGHLRDLVNQGVTRIFMPTLSSVPAENNEKNSEYMCAVVKGYPLVIRNSDNPERLGDVIFDDPLFHWYSIKDRDTQLAAWAKDALGIEEGLTHKAIAQAQAAQTAFHTELQAAGKRVIEQALADNRYAIVLASRPYHNDPLVLHDLPTLFTEEGVAVIPCDAVPGINETDLSKSRLDIVNNFHARMLSSALIAAESEELEYAQVVSFGCGHDAYLSDEIVRLMGELSHKTPLILKLDESDNQGPLRIRVRSFIETINKKRALALTAERELASARDAARNGEKTAEASTQSPSSVPGSTLSDPYAVKYTKNDRKERVILVPNTSHAFSLIMSAAMEKQGVRAVSLEIGHDEAIRLGKKYVHNDICFPAQITIGEALAALESGEYDDCDVAICTGKYIGDCRLTHYAALLRKALDDAGYEQTPIVTNDDKDDRNIHPGFKLSTASAIRIANALPMLDILEELLRKIRPYELEPGSTDATFDRSVNCLVEGLKSNGSRGLKRGFERAIDEFMQLKYDRETPRPQVLIVGEYLLNFHPGANHEIERYLEDNGLEVIEARMTDVIRKSYFFRGAQINEYHVTKPWTDKVWYDVVDKVFEHAHNVADRIASKHPLYTPAVRLPELVRESDSIIHHTFDAGEGVLIPGEILHHAAHGCRNFVILQPFGCLPNHIVGRGITKALKERYPHAQILPLDYDPDVSFANVENRLQMLIMSAKANMDMADKNEADGSNQPNAEKGAL